jgi:Protein kinase domain/Domain of unknown function (DUF4350)
MKGNLNFSLKSLKVILLFILLIFPIFLSLNVVSAQDNNTKVLFDEMNPTYGKLNLIHSIGTYGSSSFATLLESNGYTVSKLTDGPITSDKLQGYDVLIIMGQYHNYTNEEVNVIKDFVHNGGGLYLLANNWGDVDGNQNYAWNKIARSFGVSFENNQIVTNDKNYIFFQNVVEINDIQPSPITANVPKFWYMMGTYIQNPGPSKVIAYTDSYTWGDIGYNTTDGGTYSNFKKDPNERSGPLPVVSEMQYGKGKVVFMGAAESFINSMIYRSNTWKLGLNSVNWLANKPVATNYKPAGLISLNLIAFQILGMILFTGIVFYGLAFQIRRDRKAEILSIKTIKNWKFNALIGTNALLTVLGGLLFIPINFYLYDITLYSTYDPTLGYTLIISGAFFLFFMGVILYNLAARQRMVIKYSYFNIVIILLFAGLTVILGDLFGFPVMEIFTFGSLFLLIPLAVNLWSHRNYGPDLIIEGKEFDRLKKLSAKSLPYELLPFYSNSAYIGEGGFGRVFRAINQQGKEVALKIPKTFDKRSEKTFITEITNWSQLDHPHIVKLYEYKILPIPYIETEFCEEGRVEKGIKTLQEAVSIVYDAAKGLAYAHSKNIIHGDVKLSNILIKNGMYKISDWGLSKLKTGDSVTLSGATPSYAAPEQISREFGKADERTDIYQLGTVFYELLTGRLPFEGEISEIYSSILNTQPLNPAEINPNATPVKEIIMKCLNKNKNERYSTMEELLRELEKYRPPDKTILFDEK